MALYLRDAFEIKTAYDLNDDMRGGENYIYIFFLGRAKEKELTWLMLIKLK